MGDATISETRGTQVMSSAARQNTLISREGAEISTWCASQLRLALVITSASTVQLPRQFQRQLQAIADMISNFVIVVILFVLGLACAVAQGCPSTVCQVRLDAHCCRKLQIVSSNFLTSPQSNQQNLLQSFTCCPAGWPRAWQQQQQQKQHQQQQQQQ
ncbi:hypothetical protein COO60DRAFT_1545940 [Scenedesmus sp. NREL 46B-D3]|nr:hypothetical protein COO60DRAFT_1545940 [Scenedesmus sp. NREL 46B-D3]